MRFKRSTKNWRRAEIEELKSLVETTTNVDLCKHFDVSQAVLQRAMVKYNIKRSEEASKKFNSEYKQGENNPNYKNGASLDTAKYQRTQREKHPDHKKA